MAEYKLFSKNSKIKVYFADLYSPWKRRTNENTNGLIRHFFAKGTDFNKVSRSQIKKSRVIIKWTSPSDTRIQGIL